MPEPITTIKPKLEFRVAEKPPQEIARAQDQRFTVFKAIINNAYTNNPRNFNLQVLQAVTSGKAELILPNGNKLQFISFDKKTGEAVFNSQGKDNNPKQVKIKIGHLYQNLREQKEIDKLPEEQRTFLQETFVQDPASKEFTPQFHLPPPAEFEKLAGSLGIMTKESLRKTAQELRQELGTDADKINSLITAFPPENHVLSAEILDETFASIEKRAEKIDEEIAKLETLVEKVRTQSPGFLPYIREKAELDEFLRLKKLAANLKSFPRSVIDTYKKVADGDTATINGLDDELVLMLRSPTTYDLGNLLRVFGVIDNTVLESSSRLKSIIVGKIVEQKNSAGRAQVVSTTLASYFLVKLTV